MSVDLESASTLPAPPEGPCSSCGGGRILVDSTRNLISPCPACTLEHDDLGDDEAELFV